MHGFYGLFLQSVETYPDRLAVELQRTTGELEGFTYAELRTRGESVGRWLRDSGFSSGTRCAIMAGNGPLWVAAYLGVMSAGATAVPLDTAFNSSQVNKLLRDCGAEVIFTDGEHLTVVEEAVAETQVRIVMVDGSGDGRSTLRSMFAEGPGNFQPAKVQNSDVAVLMYTSGTTSDPKGVMLTHKNLLAEAESVFSILTLGPSDAILAVLPLFHALAQLANLLLPFAVGARIVYLEAMNTTELLRALSERNITLFCCVPQFFYLIHERVMERVKAGNWAARTAFRSLMGLARAGRKVGLNPGKLFFRRVHRLLGPRMRYLITGGSAFDVNIGRDLERLGFNVLQAYGLTESTGGATVTPPNANLMGSVGQPLKGVQIKILGADLAEGMAHPVGEVAIGGDIVMRGYYNRPDATAEAIQDGWLHTGDLGYLDPKGNLFITGRKKEIIVLSSGKNIYPEEIEAHYMRSPYIKEICVMGLVSRAGEPFSERLHAVIVPNFDLLRERKIVNTREVIRFDVENLSVQLPPGKRILSFDLWPTPLPRTTTRKIKRFEVHRRVLSGEAAEAETSTDELSAEEALWLSGADVQKAIAVVRRAGKSRKPVLPSSNLELDLGFDSMERVELVVALERELGVAVDDKILSQVYTVRELVDALLGAARGGASGTTQKRATPGWDQVLAEAPDDPRVISALHGNLALILFWFAMGRLAALIARLFFGLQVSGKEKLPSQGPFILSPNHQSFLDGPIVASQIPWRLFKNMFYVGTSEIFGRPPFSYLGRAFKLVPVDPDSNLVNAMRAGAYGLRKSQNLVLYPEGERSIDGTPKKFKKGAAILAAHLKVPIYPVALEGFYEAWPRGRKFPKLAKLRIAFGDPVLPPASMADPEEAYQRLTDELRRRVVGMWEELREKGTEVEKALTLD